MQGKGWTPAGSLAAGDWISTLAGGWVPVEDLYDTGIFEAVYNLRVAEDHTYFVGEEGWGFGVWAHNACIIVHQWENGMTTKHFSVEIVDGNIDLHTHQSGAVGTDTKIEPFTNRSGMAQIGQYSETIDDAHAKAAITYVTARRAVADPGPYNIVYRSCTLYVWDVMLAAGVAGLPPRPVDGDDTSRPNQLAALTVYRYFALKAKGP